MSCQRVDEAEKRGNYSVDPCFMHSGREVWCDDCKAMEKTMTTPHPTPITAAVSEPTKVPGGPYRLDVTIDTEDGSEVCEIKGPDGIKILMFTKASAVAWVKRLNQAYAFGSAAPVAQPDPAPADGLELIELVAEGIYEGMRSSHEDGKNYPWVPGGNSDMQDIARSNARKIIARRRPAAPAPKCPKCRDIGWLPDPSGNRIYPTCDCDAAPRKPSPDVRGALTAKDLQDAEQYVTYHGAIHDDGCPGDDTCSCSAKHMNDGINKVLRFARLAAGIFREPDEGFGERGRE